MTNILLLNQPFVSVGVSAFTYTVPSTGLYNVMVQATVPSAIASGAGAGTARDQGLGATGGFGGVGTGLGLGNGGTGLGFGGTANDNATGFSTGYGAGAGGGGEGFSAGDQGLGKGGVGQGFGATNGYQQPPADVHSNQTTGTAGTSSLSIVVTQNSTTVFTSPTITPTQGAVQFKVDLLCTANDVITVTSSSANTNDNQKNSLKMTVTLGQGL